MNTRNEDPAFARPTSAQATINGHRGPSRRKLRGAEEAAFFRTHAAQAVDLAANYLEKLESLPVCSVAKPGEVMALYPPNPPVAGVPLDRILRDIEEHLIPLMTHWQHPGWFAYFSSSASVAAILGDWMASVFGNNAMLHKTAPDVVEQELCVTGWMRNLLGLHPAFEGQIMPNASTSTLTALILARDAFAGIDSRDNGLAGRNNKPLTIYTSEHGHSSIDKAAFQAGFGLSNVRHISSDNNCRMLSAALDEEIRRDRDAGYLPVAIVSTAGTTATGSIDPLDEISDIAQRWGIYHHVDGAFGGMVGIDPTRRSLLRGIDRADSVVVNPHKWLTGLDCSTFFCKHPRLLRKVFSVVPSYLQHDDDADDPMNWGPSLSRRDRSMKLWFVLRHYGTEALIELVRDSIDLATQFAERVVTSNDFELVVPQSISVVVFRPKLSIVDDTIKDRINRRLIDRVIARGVASLSGTVLRGQFVIRLAVGNVRTTLKDIDLVWNALQEELPAARADIVRSSRAVAVLS